MLGDVLLSDRMTVHCEVSQRGSSPPADKCVDKSFIGLDPYLVIIVLH